MKKSKRLLPVQKLNTKREKDAAKAVGFARQAVIKEEAQLNSLIEYRKEYQSCNTVGSSPTGQQLQDLHGFLINLNVAIEQQERRLIDVRYQLNMKIVEWEKAHGKHKVMDKLIVKFEKEEDLVESKNEQKIMDDLPKNIGNRGGHLKF